MPKEEGLDFYDALDRLAKTPDLGLNLKELQQHLLMHRTSPCWKGFIAIIREQGNRVLTDVQIRRRYYNYASRMAVVDEVSIFIGGPGFRADFCFSHQSGPGLYPK